MTEAGVRELRLRPGTHRVRTLRDGGPPSEESVTITRGGKRTLSVGLEAAPAAAGGRGGEPGPTAAAGRRAAEREVERAEAAVGQAARERQAAERELGRIDKLNKSSAASDFELVEARGRLGVAAADERVAAAALSLAKARARAAAAGDRASRARAQREVAVALVARAGAELDRAAADGKRCEATHGLVLKLADGGVATATEVERSRDAIEKARAAVKAAESGLRAAREELEAADAAAREAEAGAPESSQAPR